MKKILMIILIILTTALTAYIILEGYDILSIEILGAEEIIEKSEELEETLAETTTAVSVEYEKALDNVDTAYQNLMNTKTNYEEKASISSSEQIEIANEFGVYELDTLFVKLGKHATNEGVAVTMSLLQSSSGSDIYNIDFSVTGTYICITDYLSAIENDSELIFKVEDFSLITSTEDELIAKFICNDITIEGIDSTLGVTSTTDDLLENSEEDFEMLEEDFEMLEEDFE